MCLCAGKRLFALPRKDTRGNYLVAAQVALAPEIEVSPPELLFDGPYTRDLDGHQRYTTGGYSIGVILTGCSRRNSCDSV